MDLTDKEASTISDIELDQLKARLLKTEASLERNNQHLRELFNSSNDLIQIFKPNGEFTFVNEAWRNKLGYRNDEMSPLRFMDVVHPDHRKTTLQTLLKITAGSRLERFETVLITKFGKNVYVTGNLTCVFEEEEPVEFRCIFFDITERFRAERAQALYYKIASITMNQMRLEDLYERIYLELNDILKIKNFSIALRNRKKYTYLYWINEKENQGKTYLTKDVEQLLAEYTFERGKPLIVYDDGIQKIANQKKARIKDDIPKIWLGVLIKLDNKNIGILSAYSYGDQAVYNHKDLELLDFVSGQVSLAIERQQNEEKIQNQAARLSAIFESPTHQIWSLDKTFSFTSFNKNYSDAFEEYYGLKPEIGMSLDAHRSAIMSKGALDLWKGKYELAFSGKTVNFQTSQKTLNGQKVWRDIFLNPIFMPDNSVNEISVIANDITGKKESENAIKESEEKFRNIFESFQDIYFRCDMDGRISMISPSVQEVLGLKPKTIIGKSITEFTNTKQQGRSIIKTLYSKRQIKNFETQVTSKAGETIEFLSNVRLIKRKKNQFEIEGVARDITLLKNTNDQLREAKNLAERSLKVKERFLANMSHEIRTPMNGIIGMIDLIGSTNLNTEQFEYVKTIKKSSETLLNIVNNILDLSKIEAGKMSLKQEPFNLIEAFEKVYELYSQQAHLSNNTLYYYLDDQMPAYILGDETRLIQVLSNLTSNAIKFSPSKGKINIGIKIQKKHNDQYKFKVSIKDSGIGISKKDSEKLFQSFSQIDSSSSKTFSGTGLGLAISKELVKSMNGEIGVVSTPGLGSTFWFTFTAQSVAEPAGVLREEQQITRHFRESSPRILLVDDNDINRSVAVSILSKAGCDVTEAPSGFIAIEKVTKRDYDLIFMDIQMPDMDGVETTQKIKSILLDKTPPIVAMTAYSMEEDRNKFLEDGLDDYVAKPIKAITLIETTKKWIDFEPIEVNTALFQEESEELIINQNTLNQLFKYGGKELIESVLKDFDEEATEQVANAEKAYLSGDYEDMRRELHTLKGNAGTFGVERLSSLATRIEKMLKENKFEGMESLLKQLHIRLTEFKESYRNFIES